MGEEARFIARYASVYVTGSSFAEVGDQLHARGFDMLAASQTAHGVLVVPHTKPDRQAARVFKEVPAAVEEPKVEVEDKPMSTDLAAAVFAGAKVEAGIEEGIQLECHACGAVHPEGALCMIPIFSRQKCCLRDIYPHDGPHEAATQEGLITHRWIEEVVITDLPFNGYAPWSEDDDEEAYG